MDKCEIYSYKSDHEVLQNFTASEQGLRMAESVNEGENERKKQTCQVKTKKVQ